MCTSSPTTISYSVLNCCVVSDGLTHITSNTCSVFHVENVVVLLSLYINWKLNNFELVAYYNFTPNLSKYEVKNKQFVSYGTRIRSFCFIPCNARLVAHLLLIVRNGSTDKRSSVFG